MGLSIIHAPSPLIAPQYPEHMKRHAPAPPPEPEDDWPPPAFHAREGAYHAYRGPREQPPGVWPRWDRVAPQLRMSPAVEVRDDDCVIATGQQMHEFLKARGMLHLIYMGYATNWCILSRDYGVRAMRARGYNPILLRDATMGVEFPDTLANCFATEMAIREVEQVHGFSALQRRFLRGVRRRFRKVGWREPLREIRPGAPCPRIHARPVRSAGVAAIRAHGVLRRLLPAGLPRHQALRC
ncbi:MAG: cysteine hydrolase [Anaerolineae bacterium]|nr:cysteine hydrolase [Anaerolineae bacterium]